MLTSVLGRVVAPFDSCPWGGAVGRPVVGESRQATLVPLYTPEQRVRRDSSAWTLVQGILAPVQFLVFLISLGLVLRFLATGQGELAATASVIAKTLTLYLIMVTGAIWEKEVFGRYLFAPAFFWEDATSMIVIGLHTAYLGALFTGALGAHDLMMLALAAYATYVVNAVQFIAKLRAARLQEARAKLMAHWQQRGPGFTVGQGV
jgi:3-vinyl bacteriochlorophyllide hydratase